MVIVLGSISVIVFGLCVGPIGGWIDERVSRGAAALLALTGRLAKSSSTFLLALWSPCCSRKCYPCRSRVRDIKVCKETGELVGLGIHRANRVASVTKGSLCEDLIFPGDMIHSINGHPVTNSKDVSAKLREAHKLHLVVSSPPSADDVSPSTSERRLLHAKLVVAYVASQCAVGLCALVAYANPEPVHEGWEGLDYYYFAFVTVSSVGFGDFAMGPKEGTLLGFMRLFTQATAIFFGMAFFNTLTGVGGDWASDAAERTLLCLGQRVPPLCASGMRDKEAAEPVDAGLDKVCEGHDQSKLASGDEQRTAPPPPAEMALTRALATSRAVTRFGARLKQQRIAPPTPAEMALTRALDTSRAVARFGARLKQQPASAQTPAEERLPLQDKSVKKFGARLKRSATASSKMLSLNHTRSRALARLSSRCRPVADCLLPWLALFFATMLLGGLIFMSIEADHESMVAQALRDEENAIRAVAGIELKGYQSNASSAHQAVNASVPGPDTVRAQLLEIGSMADEAQAAAVEEVVSEFTEVVGHESGCDRLADLTLLMLSECKSRPPSPISLQWSFNGATFFMLTIMTTIGYGALPGARSKCELLATLAECPHATCNSCPSPSPGEPLPAALSESLTIIGAGTLTPTGTFAPSTVWGKLLVVGLGPLGMILFGLTLGLFGNLIDAMVEWGANTLLAGISRVERKVRRAKHGSPAEDSPDESPDADTRMLHAKMVVAFVMLHATLAIAAAFAYAASEHFNGEQWGFGSCYYFAFASFSTIGFGDFAMGPTDDSTAQLLILHLQAIVILVGLAAFNAFASIGADWVRAVADDVAALVRRLCCLLGSYIRIGPPRKVAPEPQRARVAPPVQAPRSSSSSPLPPSSLPPSSSQSPSPRVRPPPESDLVTAITCDGDCSVAELMGTPWNDIAGAIPIDPPPPPNPPSPPPPISIPQKAMSTVTATPEALAVVRVQALLRRWQGAREATARRVEREQAQRAQRKAAHLQAAERGRMARKDVSEKRALHMAATCLQRTHRGRVMRAEPSSTLRTQVELIDDTHGGDGALIDDTDGRNGTQGSGVKHSKATGGSQAEGEQIAGHCAQSAEKVSMPPHPPASPILQPGSVVHRQSARVLSQPASEEASSLVSSQVQAAQTRPDHIVQLSSGRVAPARANCVIAKRCWKAFSEQPTKLASRLAHLRGARPCAQSDMRVPTSVCRVPMGPARARQLTLRLLRAVLGMYVIMLCGGGLLFAAEGQHEVDRACADRAEENRRRESMRLLPLTDDVCTFHSQYTRSLEAKA